MLVGVKADRSILTSHISWELALALHHCDGQSPLSVLVARTAESEGVQPDGLADRLTHAFEVLAGVGAVGWGPVST